MAKSSIETIDNSVLDLLKKQFEIVTEDTIDAVGVGEYIPDDLDELGGAAEGDDILKAKIKIGKIKTVETKPGTISVAAVKTEGVEKQGDIHNDNINPVPQPPKPLPPRPVIPDDDNATEGATPGNGSKTMIVPNLSAQRAFPINASMGLYKIVIKPTETYENLYLSCSALGEDGRSDPLNMETFTYDGKAVKISDGKAGPISTMANIPAVFFVKFTSKEKMVLNLHIMEVCKK